MACLYERTDLMQPDPYLICDLCQCAADHLLCLDQMAELCQVYDDTQIARALSMASDRSQATGLQQLHDLTRRAVQLAGSSGYVAAPRLGLSHRNGTSQKAIDKTLDVGGRICGIGAISRRQRCEIPGILHDLELIAGEVEMLMRVAGAHGLGRRARFFRRCHLLRVARTCRYAWQAPEDRAYDRGPVV